MLGILIFPTLVVGALGTASSVFGAVKLSLMPGLGFFAGGVAETPSSSVLIFRFFPGAFLAVSAVSSFLSGFGFLLYCRLGFGASEVAGVAVDVACSALAFFLKEILTFGSVDCVGWSLATGAGVAFEVVSFPSLPGPPTLNLSFIPTTTQCADWISTS